MHACMHEWVYKLMSAKFIFLAQPSADRYLKRSCILTGWCAGISEQDLQNWVHNSFPQNLLSSLHIFSWLKALPFTHLLYPETWQSGSSFHNASLSNWWSNLPLQSPHILVFSALSPGVSFLAHLCASYVGDWMGCPRRNRITADFTFSGVNRVTIFPCE